MTQITILKVRRILRSPYTTTLSYLALISATCALGAVTFWADYHFWQVPSILLGIVSNLAAFLGGLGITHVVCWAVRRPIDWRFHLHRIFRRGYPTIVFCLLTVALVIAIPIVPHAESPIPALYHELEQTRQLLQPVYELQKEIRTKPRYKNDPEVIFAEKVLAYRLRKQVELHEYEQFANLFYRYRNDKSPHIRNWSRVLAADALNRSHQVLKATALYANVAEDTEASPYLRGWAYQELGVSSYSYVGDTEAAAQFWEAALELKQSRGLLENLAQVYSDKGDWKTAETYYREAETFMRKLMERTDAVSLGQQWAVLYVNWANMYRRQAIQLEKNPSRIPLLQSAIAKLEQAKGEDGGYLDLYWTGTRVMLASEDLEGAHRWLDDADRVIAKPAEYDLNRLSYDKIGAPFSAWLRCVVIYEEDSAQGLPDRLWRKLLVLPGFDRSPVVALFGLLQEVKDTGMTVGEDLITLLQMAEGDFLKLCDRC